MSVQQPAADAHLDLTEKTNAVFFGLALLLVPLVILGCCVRLGWM